MCFCACHWDRDKSLITFDGADVSDPVAAAVACDSCRDSHCLALVSMRLANDPEPERREKFEWVDPPNPVDKPTGQADGEDGG